MASEKKRGRPPSQKTLEKRRIDEMLRNPPEHIRAFQAVRGQDRDMRALNGEEVRLQLLKDYKHSATTPNQHAYDMASVGEDPNSAYETSILNNDLLYQEQTDANQFAGGQAMRANAQHLANKLWEKNKTLLERSAPLGRVSHSHAANIILNDWKNKGFGGPPPTERTIRRYIKLGSPYKEER